MTWHGRARLTWRRYLANERVNDLWHSFGMLWLRRPRSSIKRTR